MSAQDVMIGERIAHIRELKTEIEKLKTENGQLREEVASLWAHFDLALLSAQELRTLPAGGRLEIWDGWNLILGAQKEARDRADLLEQARRATAADESLRVWIVLDGPQERVKQEGRVRLSYTGGTGEHRADKFICDYLRMAKYLGLVNRVVVRTNDKDFARTVGRLGATLLRSKRFEWHDRRPAPLPIASERE